MSSVYAVGDTVYTDGGEMLTVMGVHPSIEGLLIVEGHDSKPRYIMDTAVYAVK